MPRAKFRAAARKTQVGSTHTITRGHARDLRQNLTDEEAKMWHALRKRRLDGLKFRRQCAVYEFILDFYCPQARLGVELDGAHHDADRDRARDARLSFRGIEVLRFTNDRWHREPDCVLQSIAARARIRLPLYRPRERGSGGEGSHRTDTR
jgi:very-short-patch-repair endonuclease